MFTGNLCSLAEKGYKVAISGTGADELFTGYYDHHNLYLHEIFHNKKLYKLLLTLGRNISLI